MGTARAGWMAKRARSQAGFTLAEVVIAVGIIGLGIVGVSAGLLYAWGGLEAGKQQTTAAFLAEQRIEQVKGTALANFAAVTTATFPAEAYGSIANAATYRRTVAITNNPGGLVDTKLVEVTVFYRPVTGLGVLPLPSRGGPGRGSLACPPAARTPCSPPA